MKKIILFISAILMILCVACTSLPEESATVTDAETTAAAAETETQTEPATEEVTEPE